MGSINSVNDKNKIKYKNNNNNIKELFFIIDEISELLHFYKKIIDSNRYIILKEYKVLSQKSITYIDKINFKITEDDFYKELQFNEMNIEINTFKDIVMMIMQFKDFYEEVDELTRKKFVIFMFCLMQLTLFYLTETLTNFQNF